MQGNDNLVEEFKIRYRDKTWIVQFFSKGIEIDHIKKRVVIYNEKEKIPYGQTRSFLKEYCRVRYGQEIPSNSKLSTYELVKSLKSDYDFFKLIYKHREDIK